jgi:hypothetical protein
MEQLPSVFHFIIFPSVLSPEAITVGNNICVANVNEQSARKCKENVSTEIEDQGSLYPVLKSSNTEYCFFASLHCSV